MSRQRGGAAWPRHAAALLSLGLVAFARPGLASPFLPSSDDAVIETLTPPGDPALKEMRALAATARTNPGELAPAIAYARRAIEFARRNGDPRFAGYAEAAMRPWVSGDQVPPAAAFMDAVLHQYRHDFTGASTTLDALLATESGNVEIRLVRATVRQVTGDIAGASADCAELAGRTDFIVAATCSTAALEADGRSAPARRSLEIALALPAPPAIRLWSLTLAAEMAARHGEPDKAEKHYREALAIDGQDLALVSSYSDFLLDAGRNKEARALLGTDTRIDAILLRSALAARAEGDADAAELSRIQEERFAEAKLRSDTSHRREEARFVLHLKGDPAAALTLALANWDMQREPWDARLVLEAALAAHKPHAAAPVRDWLAAHHNDDRQLANLVQALDTAS